MSTSAAPPRLNGNSVVPGEGRRETEFLEKLLQIRDDVLAGKHPCIRLPSKVLEQVAPRPQNSLPPKPTINSSANGIGYQLPPRPEGSFPKFQSPPKNDFSPTPHGSRPFSAKPASGIDPVLLTKSDHLIRAELQLKRQQLERVLKDQVDKKARSNEEEREALDVENLLNQAHSIVQPVSGLANIAASSDSAESFDENSYYSSKADSWSSSEIDRNQNPKADATDSLTIQRRRSAEEAQVNSSKLAPSGRAAHTVIDLDEEYEPTDEIDIYEPEPAHAHAHEELDESDYSPPPAETTPQDSRRTRGRGTIGVANGSPNHSPAGLPPRIQNNRKRKREHKRNNNDNRNNNNGNNNPSKRIARSPEPVVIKEEPVSPPPFASPLAREEIVFARESSRGPSSFAREADLMNRAPRYHEEQLSPGSVRLNHRRAERADDLRRVASLQYARRPLSPLEGDAYPVPEPRVMRAASHAFAERPLEHAIYRDGSSRPSAAPRYVHDRSRSPVHEYVSRPQSPMIMAPPRSRQIVVDQYGNRYYAAPADVRPSVAPPNRVMEVDPYYERAVTREPTMRGPARTIVYEDDHALRMPPPPPRRYIEVSDSEPMDARTSRREASHRPSGMYDEMAPPREYIPSRAFSVRPEMPRREIPEGYARHESIQPGHGRVAAPPYREVSVHHGPYDDGRYALATPSRRYAEESAAERPVEVMQEPFAGDARAVRYRY